MILPRLHLRSVRVIGKAKSSEDLADRLAAVRDWHRSAGAIGNESLGGDAQAVKSWVVA